MATPLKSVLDGANLEDFGHDDQHVVVGTPTAPSRPANVHVKPAKKITAPAPVAAAPTPPAITDFGDDDEEAVVSSPAAAPPAQAPAPAAQPEAAPGHVHEQPILDLAARWGIDPSEAGLYSREELRKELLRLRREDTARTQQSTKIEPAAPQPEPAVQIDWGTHDAPDGQGKRTWTDDDLSPALVKAMKDQAKEIAELKKQLAQVTNVTRQQVQAPLVQRVLNQVGKYGAFFANGQPMTGSAEHKRCLMVMQALDDMGRAGRSPNPEVDVPEVMKTLFGLDAPGAAAPAPVPAPVQKPAPVPAPRTKDPELQAIEDGFANGTVQRPTNRNAPPLPKGEKRASAAAAAFLRSKGIEPVGGIENDDTEFG